MTEFIEVECPISLANDLDAILECGCWFCTMRSEHPAFDFHYDEWKAARAPRFPTSESYSCGAQYCDDPACDMHGPLSLDD